MPDTDRATSEPTTFLRYRHARHGWHLLAAATVIGVGVACAGTAVLSISASIRRESPGLAALAVPFGAFAVAFAAAGRRGWRGAARLRAAQSGGGDRYGIRIIGDEVHVEQFDPLGDRTNGFELSSVRSARVRTYDHRPWTHLELVDGRNVWIPTFLLGRADRAAFFELVHAS